MSIVGAFLSLKIAVPDTNRFYLSALSIALRTSSQRILEEIEFLRFWNGGDGELTVSERLIQCDRGVFYLCGFTLQLFLFFQDDLVIREGCINLWGYLGPDYYKKCFQKGVGYELPSAQDTCIVHIYIISSQCQTKVSPPLNLS